MKTLATIYSVIKAIIALKELETDVKELGERISEIESQLNTISNTLSRLCCKH